MTTCLLMSLVEGHTRMSPRLSDIEWGGFVDDFGQHALGGALLRNGKQNGDKKLALA